MDETPIGKSSPRRLSEDSYPTLSDDSYPCNNCKMHFSSLSELEKHQKVHIKKEFECDVCGRTYSWEQNLIRHQKTTKHLSGRRPQNQSHSSVSHRRELQHIFNNKLHKNTEASKLHVNLSAHKAKANSKVSIKANSKVSKNPYACDICGKVFRFKNYVPVHRRLHLNLKPYKCSICEKEYGLLSSYKNHVKGHTNTNIKKRFSKPPAKGLSDQQKTVRQKVKNPSACDICGKVFSNKNYVPCHKRIHYGLKPFKCTLCKMEFRYKSNYNKHVKEQCDTSEEKCSVSSLAENFNDQDKEDRKALRRRNNFTSYALLHNGPSVRISLPTLPTKSLNSESNRISCKLCGNTFSRKDSLLVHMRIHAGAKPYECTLCNMKFRVASNYRKHIKEMHPNIIKSKKVGKKNMGVLCSYCLKVFPSRLDLLRHSKSHRRYSCKKCNKNFALKIDMVMHMKAAHDVKDKLDKSDQLEDGINESNEKSPRYNEGNKNENGSEVCQETFPDAAALKKHKATVRVEGKPHVCDVCHRVFKLKVNLARHYTSHRRGRRMVLTSEVKPKQSSSRRILHRCESCKISFIAPSEYLQHRLMHFKCGPHECQDCKVDFKNLTDFGNHMKNVHGSSKPFVCNKCDKKCSHYVNLVWHILIFHENFKINPRHDRALMGKASFNNHDKKSNKRNRNHILSKDNTLENNQLPSEQPLIENNNLDAPSSTTSTRKSKTDIHHKFSYKLESKVHVCALCKEEFTTYYFMKVHMKHAHKNVRGMTLRKKIESCKVPTELIHAFECHLCEERFPSKYLMSKHMRTNHENTTSLMIHTCLKCKQMFLKKGIYDEHVKICQSKCDMNCRNEDTFGNVLNSVAKLAEEQNTKPKGNRISQEKEYNGNNKLQETGGKPELVFGNENIEDLLGNILPEDFANKSPETYSQKSHKDEEIKVDCCPLCREEFTSDLLSKHMKITHKVSRMLFTCLRCKQLFCKSSSYKEHVKICLNESVLNLVTEEESTVKIFGSEIEVTDHRQNTELREGKTSKTRVREEYLRYQETENGEQQELIENAEVQASKITAAHRSLNGNRIKVGKHNKAEHTASSKMEVNDKQSRPQETKDGEQELLHEKEESEFQANKSEDLTEKVFTDERPVVLDFPVIKKFQEIECTEHESLSGDYENFICDNENVFEDNLSRGMGSDVDDSESDSSTATKEGRTLQYDMGGIVTKSNEVETVNDQTDNSGSGINEVETVNNPTDNIGSGINEAETINNPTDNIGSGINEVETVNDPRDNSGSGINEVEIVNNPTDNSGSGINEVETVNDQTDTNGSRIDDCNNTRHDTTLEKGECLKSKELRGSRNESQSKIDICDRSSKERTRQLSLECESGISTTSQISDKRETEIEEEIAERGSTASHNNFKPSKHGECNNNVSEQNLHIYSESDTGIINDSMVVPEGKENTPKERCDVPKSNSKRQTVKQENYNFVANCSGYQPFRRSVAMNCLATPNKSQSVPKYVVIRNVNVANASFYEAKVVNDWMKY